MPDVVIKKDGPTSLEARQNFLRSKFKTYKELDTSRKLMGLYISQSYKGRIRYRHKCAPKNVYLVTFRLSLKTGIYSRAEGTRGVCVVVCVCVCVCVCACVVAFMMPSTHSRFGQK